MMRISLMLVDIQCGMVDGVEGQKGRGKRYVCYKMTSLKKMFVK